MGHSAKDRERDKARRDRYRKLGLTARGKPRKPRYTPKPHQAMKLVKPSTLKPGQDRPKGLRTPMNVLKRPVKLPKVEPLTDQEREES